MLNKRKTLKKYKNLLPEERLYIDFKHDSIYGIVGYNTHFNMRSDLIAVLQKLNISITNDCITKQQLIKSITDISQEEYQKLPPEQKIAIDIKQGTIYNGMKCNGSDISQSMTDDIKIILQKIKTLKK